MITKEELGAKIRQLRIERGKSQEALGVALSRTHATISDIERGKTDVTVRDLYVIANFLDVPVTEFLSIEERNSVAHPSFVQSRDAKDITPKEKKYADKVSDDFIKLARELAKDKSNE
ncbi:helix-turn-helix transcriptional regulator [Candidatus Daviesbacteria bacterium]|nr:helix-turn-helix transcriptional regulator [Candidatus Daviesbacteria bacterium]